MKSKNFSWIWIIIFSIVLSLPVILPYFHAGYFPTHDGEWAVVRLADMFRTLRDFQIPARYSGELNFGYGYPLFNFTYPFPYYLGVGVHLLGFNFVNTMKILFAGSVIFSALFMFLASRSLWKSAWAGIASSILYVYFPYRMVDLYVRGSIGESLSFALFPLLFYLMLKLINKPSVVLICGIGISVGILVLTHNIMAVLFAPFYVAFAIILILLRNKKAVKPFIISIFLGFGLSAFFWIPALFEKSNILLSQIPIADRNLYFVMLEQFVVPGWGYGVPTDQNGFSYQLGLVHLAVFAATALFLLFVFVKNKYLIKEHFSKIAILLIMSTLFFTFLLFKPSEFLWKNLPLLYEINYPWIVLGILGFIISLLAGFLPRQILGKYIVIFLAIIAIFAVYPYAKPQKYIDNPDSYYLTNHATTTSSNELMPLWVKKFPSQRPTEKTAIIKGRGVIGNVISNSRQVRFSINALSQSIVRINTIYFPGWKVSVDNIDVPISYSNEKGVMDISISKGKHMVNAKFGETSLRLISDVISALSIFAILFLTIKRGRYAFS